MTAFRDSHPATLKGPMTLWGSNILCFGKVWPGRRGFVVALLCVWKHRCAFGDCSLTRVSCRQDRAGCSGGRPEWHLPAWWTHPAGMCLPEGRLSLLVQVGVLQHVQVVKCLLVVAAKLVVLSLMFGPTMSWQILLSKLFNNLVSSWSSGLDALSH